MRTGDFLQAGRDVGAVEIIGAAQLCYNQQMMGDFRTRHQSIADALAKVTAKTHLIEQARLIGIDATGESRYESDPILPASLNQCQPSAGILSLIKFHK